MKKKTKVTNITKWVSLFLISLGVLVLSLDQGAIAQQKQYPTRTISIISPYKPGGGTEVELRNLSPFLQKYLGQTVVIKAVPGGGTTLGCSEAARSKPDGYTLLCNPLPHTILAQELLSTDSQLENFEYIYGWFEGPMDVTVRADSPYKSFSDLVEASKKKSLKSAIAGIGSIDHLHLLLLEKYVGLKAVTVPYAGGGPATAAVIRGDVDFFPGLSTTSIRFVRDGKIRELLILGPKPLEALPDTPTIYQLGYKDYPHISFIRGVSAPPGTPREIVAILEAAFQKAVDDPGFRELMGKQGRPVKNIPGKELKEVAQNSLKLAKEYMPLMKKAQEKK